MLTNQFQTEKIDFELDERVCYCFNHTRRAIEEDYLTNGKSQILAQIAAAKKDGCCQCAVKNPKGC